MRTIESRRRAYSGQLIAILDDAGGVIDICARNVASNLMQTDDCWYIAHNASGSAWAVRSYLGSWLDPSEAEGICREYLAQSGLADTSWYADELLSPVAAEPDVMVQACKERPGTVMLISQAMDCEFPVGRADLDRKVGELAREYRELFVDDDA